MSPIKDPSVYPEDWAEIRGRILERAGHRCECEGECGKDHRPENAPPSVRVGGDEFGNHASIVHATWGPGDPRCRRRHGEQIQVNSLSLNPTTAKTVLTIAHLDHNASLGNHEDDNLKAMCQGCHLRFDSEANRVKRTGQERLIGREKRA